MKNFEYNWATAEMARMYLRNSRAQERRKARKAATVSAVTQDAPVTDTGHTAASGGTGGPNNIGDSSSDEDSSDNK